MEFLDRLRMTWRTGVVTSRYSAEPPVLEPAVRGLPELDPVACTGEAACIAACPPAAIALSVTEWVVDAGRCVMCGVCERACPTGAIRLGTRVTLAARTPEGLLHRTARQSTAPREEAAQ